MTFEYKVAYSARKTVCVSISPENEVTVRCPRGYSRRKIEEFLQRKSAWISKHLAANLIKIEQNTDLTTYSSVLVKGKKLPLILDAVNKISPDEVRIKSLKLIKKLFLSEFADEFSARVWEICKITGLSVATVSFKSYTARWGCCDARNNVIFNYKLFMLDGGLWDYVIIHELCHTKFHDHSVRFWRLVESYMPDYRARRKRLKSFDFITSLY